MASTATLPESELNFLKDAIKYAASKAVTFVVAAGNEETEVSGEFDTYVPVPVWFRTENMISVAAQAYQYHNGLTAGLMSLDKDVLWAWVHKNFDCEFPTDVQVYSFFMDLVNRDDCELTPANLRSCFVERGFISQRYYP